MKNKFKMPDLEPKTFYKVGKYFWFTSALIGMIRIVDIGGKLKSYEIFSSIASILFYVVLFLFFGSLQRKEDIAELRDEDIFKMEDALNKLNLEGGEKCQEIPNTNKTKLKKK